MKIKMMLFTLLIGLSTFPTQVVAQQSTYSDLSSVLPDIQITENRATFSLADLGISERNLIGPFDETSILFGTPPNWQLAPGSTIQLQFDVLISGTGINLNEDVSYVAGVNLLIRFNNILLGMVTIDKSGSYVQSFSIPDEAFISTRADGRHALTISFDASLSCSYDLNASVTIKLSSIVDLFYQQTNPTLDLSKLPAPFYLENSLVSDSTLIIIKDNPTSTELQAALNVATGFGAMINDIYNFRLLNYSSLNDTLLAQNNLVFVGLAESFDILSGVNFKPLVNTQNVDDGILQLALSPWNSSKSVLFVSGNSLDALSKAAYAFSTGNILIYQEPEVAYVSNVQFLPSEIPVVEQFKLEDLGYASQTLEGAGRLSEDFVFYISKSQVVSTDAYIELIFSHSGLADYTASAFSLYLNGSIFFTKVLAKETEQVTTLQIRIPPGFFRYGENILELQVDMLASPGCDEATVLRPWFTVSNQSLFFVPASQLNTDQVFIQDLKFYPEIFTISSDLSEITFIVPPDNLNSWQVAAQLAFNLGTTAQPGISNMKVAFADAISEEIKENQSMIVIGMPSDLLFISEINDVLPAPFDFDTNTASEKQLMISYRIPQGQSVGYLELLRSPFNEEKTILVVSGNTDEGVNLAGDTLVIRNLQDQLAGIFAVTNGTQIATSSANMSFSIVGQGVPGSEQIGETTISSETAPLDIETPRWLMPVIVSTSTIILIVSVIVFRRFLFKDQLRRKQEKLLEEAFDEDTKDEEKSD